MRTMALRDANPNSSFGDVGVVNEGGATAVVADPISARLRERALRHVLPFFDEDSSTPHRDSLSQAFMVRLKSPEKVFFAIPSRPR